MVSFSIGEAEGVFQYSVRRLRFSRIGPAWCEFVSYGATGSPPRGLNAARFPDEASFCRPVSLVWLLGETNSLVDSPNCLSQLSPSPQFDDKSFQRRRLIDPLTVVRYPHFPILAFDLRQRSWFYRNGLLVRRSRYVSIPRHDVDLRRYHRGDVVEARKGMSGVVHS